MKQTLNRTLVAVFSSAFLMGMMADAWAGPRVKNNTRTSVNRGGGGGAAHNANRGANVNRNNNVNRNTNVNRNANVNVNRHVDVDVDNDRWGRDYHPVATAAAVTATVAVTSAVIGSITRTLPSGCVPYNAGGIVYQQCGGTYYQPQYQGSSVQYVVVNRPY